MQQILSHFLSLGLVKSHIDFESASQYCWQAACPFSLNHCHLLSTTLIISAISLLKHFSFLGQNVELADYLILIVTCTPLSFCLSLHDDLTDYHSGGSTLRVLDCLRLREVTQL